MAQIILIKYLLFVFIYTHNRHMKTNKPNSNDLYKKYRALGHTQTEANRKAIQEIIDWGVQNGHLESAWATKKASK